MLREELADISARTFGIRAERRKLKSACFISTIRMMKNEIQ